MLPVGLTLIFFFWFLLITIEYETVIHFILDFVFLDARKKKGKWKENLVVQSSWFPLTLSNLYIRPFELNHFQIKNFFLRLTFSTPFSKGEWKDAYLIWIGHLRCVLRYHYNTVHKTCFERTERIFGIAQVYFGARFCFP